MSTQHTVIETPIGPLTLVGQDSAALVGVYMDQHRHAPDAARHGVRADNDPLLEQAADQLHAYFAGRLREFDLPIRFNGTQFQQQVWTALSAIPYGQTWSYGQLARHLGKPGASRAVGLANGRNPVSIVVPCHRVIGSDGSLTGYGGGMARKEWLLRVESSRVVYELVTVSLPV